MHLAITTSTEYFQQLIIVILHAIRKSSAQDWSADGLHVITNVILTIQGEFKINTQTSCYKKLNRSYPTENFLTITTEVLERPQNMLFMLLITALYMG